MKISKSFPKQKPIDVERIKHVLNTASGFTQWAFDNQPTQTAYTLHRWCCELLIELFPDSAEAKAAQDKLVSFSKIKDGEIK